MKKLLKVIDVTPKWIDLLPSLIERAANGDLIALGELERLANIADKYNQEARNR